MIAGAGYLIDSTTQLLSPGFPLVSTFTFLGEPALALWLLIKGVEVERQQAVA